MPPFRLLLLPLAVALLALPAYAAPQPDAGVLLEGLKPAPPLPARDTSALPQNPARPVLKMDTGIGIAVKTFRITGARAFPEAELLTLLDDARGQSLTLAQLQALAERITRHYREAGYLLARAYLPAQDIRDGEVEIAILEGRLSRLRIDNTAPLADERVASALAGISEGETVDGAALERRLLLLNDLPGVEVKSTLRPGASVGTTDLDIRLSARAPLYGSVELDNYGNRYTGTTRLGAGLTWASPAGLGDSLRLRALAAEGMAYGRLAWQLPVGGAGTQVGAAWSEMRYELGKDFARLEAHGSARISSLYLVHPFLRTRLANVNGQLSYDRKDIDDSIDFTRTITSKTVDVWTLGLSGDRVDGFGGGATSAWSVSYTAGRLALDPANKIMDSVGHHTTGDYAKGNLSLMRLQRLAGDFAVHASLQAQWAGKNLDTSEKMSLGGPLAVRAYPQGEAPADDAWLANLELRYRLAPDWQAGIFYDAARGRLNHRPLATDSNNYRRLGGAGLGLSFERPGDLSLRLSVAWRDDAAPTSDSDRSPRAWLQAIKYF